MDNIVENSLWFSEWEPIGFVTLEGGFYQLLLAKAQEFASATLS